MQPASAVDEPLGEPYFQRRFEAARTQEVRVYLYGGNDKVVVTGDPHGGVLLRVVGGDGVDVLDDSKGGATRFSAAQDESEGHYRVAAGPGTHWDRRPYPPPPPNKNADWIPARDWGRVTGPLFLLSYGGDYGALVGGSLNTIGYGFRKDPWSDKQSLRLVYSTKQSGLRGTYLGQFRFENSPWRVGVAALGSGIEVSSFFGSGNTTTFEGKEDTYKLGQDRFEIEPALIYGPTPDLDLSLGFVAKYDTTEPRDNPVLGGEAFYGQGNFTQVCASARFRFDGTDHRALPRRGLFLTGTGHLYPAVVDVTDTFGEVHGDARAYLSTPNERGITLAMRAGGQKVFGAYPFFESAFLGGKTPFSLLEPGAAPRYGASRLSATRGMPACMAGRTCTCRSSRPSCWCRASSA